MHKKRVSLSPATTWMLVILFLAVLLRFVFMKLNWPGANSDEAVIDLMARHIAYQGEHPIFFWGQFHMGTIQAYLGAGLIHFWGSSAFSVRMGTLLIFALYLVSMYFLVRLLYTPLYALFIIALLSIGSDRMIGLPLIANGGYAETLLFGALIFLLVSWLALTAPRQRALVARSRVLIYAGLGLVVGLSLWSDQLILSALLTAGVLLWLCCRQELRDRASIALLLGFLIGAMPLILYNLSAAPGENSLSVLVGTVFSGAPRTIPLSESFAHVLFLGLPSATGLPFTTGIHTVCSAAEPYVHPVSSLAALFPSSNPWLCLGMNGGWSLSILLLWGIALVGVVLAVRRLRGVQAELVGDDDAEGAWRQKVRQYARGMLLCSGALWLLLFAFSAGAAYTPRSSCRYLIVLLLAAPAIYWPLWQGVSQVREGLKQNQRFVRSLFVLSALVLCVVSGVYLVGVGDIVANIPDTQRSFSQMNTLIQQLQDRGATRVYTDYDTCNVLMLQSDEHIICSVLDDQLQPGMNRYTLYSSQVAAAANPAYLFTSDSAANQAIARRFAHDAHYQHFEYAGYSVYYYSSGS